MLAESAADQLVSVLQVLPGTTVILVAGEVVKSGETFAAQIADELGHSLVGLKVPLVALDVHLHIAFRAFLPRPAELSLW